jgi:hypothetical protein
MHHAQVVETGRAGTDEVRGLCGGQASPTPAT